MVLIRYSPFILAPRSSILFAKMAHTEEEAEEASFVISQSSVMVTY